jgi:hypothetical protein
MTTHGRTGAAPCGPQGHDASAPQQEPTKIRIRPRLKAKMVIEARRWGLDLSRIVEEGLVREIEAERRRRQADRDQDCEGGNGTGSSTEET